MVDVEPSSGFVFDELTSTLPLRLLAVGDTNDDGGDEDV